MTIHQNLRTLRLAKGMTQEEAAAQLHVTRQTISSYESGRTRPDVETLVHLAQIYRVSLKEILYGTQPALRARRRFYTFAWGLAGLLVTLTVLRSGLMCAANLLFPIGSGLRAEEISSLAHIRQQLADIWTLLETVLLFLAHTGAPLVVFLDLLGKFYTSLRQVGLYCAALIGGLLLASLPFVWLDPIFAPADYLILLLQLLAPAPFFLGIWLLLCVLSKRRQHAKHT